MLKIGASGSSGYLGPGVVVRKMGIFSYAELTINMIDVFFLSDDRSQSGCNAAEVKAVFFVDYFSGRVAFRIAAGASFAAGAENICSSGDF